MKTYPYFTHRNQLHIGLDLNENKRTFIRVTDKGLILVSLPATKGGYKVGAITRKIEGTYTDPEVMKKIQGLECTQAVKDVLDTYGLLPITYKAEPKPKPEKAPRRKERKQVSDNSAFTVKDLAEATGLKPIRVRKLLRKLNPNHSGSWVWDGTQYLAQLQLVKAEL